MSGDRSGAQAPGAQVVLRSDESHHGGSCPSRPPNAHGHFQVATASVCLVLFPRKGLASNLPFSALLFTNGHCCVDFTLGAAGSLKTPGSSNVGMLDLGGGSTQITFLPRFEVTRRRPQGHLPHGGASAPGEVCALSFSPEGQITRSECFLV